MKSEWIEKMIKKDDTFEYNYWKKKNFLRKKGRENNQFDTRKISSETFTVKLNFIETTSRLIYIPPLNLFLLSIRIPFRITIDPFTAPPSSISRRWANNKYFDETSTRTRKLTRDRNWEVGKFLPSILPSSTPIPLPPSAWRIVFYFHPPRFTALVIQGRNYWMPGVRRRHKEVRKGPRVLGPESFKIEEMHREPTFLSPWYSGERDEEVGSVRVETGSIKTPVKVFLLRSSSYI